LLSSSAVNAQTTPDPVLTVVAGAEEVIWQWSEGGKSPWSRCDPQDAPDAPANAFRNHDEMISLLGHNNIAFRMVGLSFNLGGGNPLVRDCSSPIFSSNGTATSLGNAAQNGYSAHNDHEWLNGTYADELTGRFITATSNVEYHAHRDGMPNGYPNDCIIASANRPPLKPYEVCWTTSLAHLYSTNGGETFIRGRIDDGPRVFASILNNSFVVNQGPGAGYRSPTSPILLPDGYFYMIVTAKDTYNSVNQTAGPCVLRCDPYEIPSSPGSLVPRGNWLAYDGTGPTGFTVNLFTVETPNQVSVPVFPDSMFVRSILYVEDLGKVVAIGGDKGPSPNTRVVYRVSENMIDWGPQQLLHDSGVEKEKKDSILYSSVIDHMSSSRNYNRSNTGPIGVNIGVYLYFTARDVDNNAPGTHYWFERSLRRLPIAITQ
jgi:hypothetical protein